MSKSESSQYIIAIGASAGGLEAISAFFDYTPLDSVTYIVIQHLAPDFKSVMAQLLSRHSKLQVMEATDNLEIKANKVYLIPSSKYLSIADGKLVLSDKKEKQGPHMTIDHFLQSLAEERGNKAIGIIMSGTGHDGSNGAEAIKKAGGLIIAQDPDTANFTEMPMSVIASGYTDIVLSPEAMPQVIEQYVKEGVLESLTDDASDAISESELAGIISLIKGNLPLDFTDYKRPTILRRVKRRMVQNSLIHVNEYYELLRNSPVELEILANDFLIGVTSFFRDPEAFEIIEKQVIPEIIDHKLPGEVLKIWIAGCATGEEAYSLAILIKEHLIRTGKDQEVKIFATDINRASLDIASKGIYSEKIEKAISPERLDKFFTRNGATYKVRHEIRHMLIFAQHNLVTNPPYCNIDLISCRNLLIYMNLLLQKKIFSMMHFGLKKDGFLFLGPSENASVLMGDFSEISNKWNILRSNKNGRSVRFDTFSSPVIEGIKTTTMEINKITEVPSSRLGVADEISQAILEESGFSGICTDENLKVVQSFGNPSGYLKNEIFNFNLNDLLPDGIAIAFKAAAHKALQLDQKVLLDGVNFGTNDMAGIRLVNVIIKPVRPLKAGGRMLLILFSENSTKAKNENVINSADIKQLTKEHVIHLERELLESKHKLDVAHERIESSNENMQSFNEELLSANEEMQSANEELQSVNEELQSINKEHQITNTALTESNDDLNNYFRSNVNGQLFVDRDLLLKKYSPGAVKHINIRETDIGRPLSNITTNIRFETMIDDIKRVILDESTIVREAESEEGNVYQVMTMPYVRKNSAGADGAIISFYDITELKNTLKELNNNNQILIKVNADLNNFVHGASHDLNAPIFNIEMILNILNKKIDLKDPGVLELSEMINKAVSSFKSVIGDLAKVGNIEADMLEEYREERFDDLFGEINEIISQRILVSKAVMTTNFQQTTIRFPKKNLRSIMLNLITNAIKFCSPERLPEIMIKTEMIGDFIVLTVKDNGMGITKNRIDLIFNLYQRLNDDVEGQGIGLYLIRKIIDAAGGKIEVESEVGKGSTFSIYFKAA